MTLRIDGPDVGGQWHDEFMSLIAPTADMVGRDAELATLDDALRRAVDGEAAAVLVAGEAGIGKTRLLSEFRKRAVSSADVFAGWCLDYGSTPAPYAPLPAILRGALEALGDPTAESAGPARAALRLLLPELGRAPGADALTERSDFGPEGLREAIVNVLESAASARPVVILIEDLHWADEATLALLSFLLRALADSRILFVLTCRVDEVRRGGAVRTFLAEAERARLLERLALQRLDAIEVRALAEALAGPIEDGAFERVLERSDGVPFFIEELSCNALGPIPETLRDVLLSRYDSLSDDAKRVVRTASGSDGSLDHDLLARLVGVDDIRLDAGIREAVNAAILTVRPDDLYDFRHALLREAVHDDLLPGERARLHRAYAEALEERAVDDSCCLESALAFHWHQAHDPRRALVAAVGAMNRAKRTYAFSTAAHYGELALELWDQVPDAAEATGVDHVGLLSRLGSILRNAGDGERALMVVDQALDEVDRDAVAPGVLVRLLRDRSMYLTILGRPGQSEQMQEAIDVMDSTGLDDVPLRTLLLNLLAGRLMIAARLDEAMRAADEAYRLAEAAGDDTFLSIAANTRGNSRVHLGDVEGGLADFRLSWQHAVSSDPQLRYRVNYSDALYHLGRYGEAVRVAEGGISHARALGIERTTGSILTQNRAEPLLELGDIEQVERLLATDLTVRTHRIFRAYTTMTRIRALAWRGRLDEADELLDEWRPTMRQIAAFERQVLYALLGTQIIVRLNSDDPQGAAAALRELLGDPGPDIAHKTRVLLDGGWTVSALRAHGREADAAALADEVRAAWDRTPESLHPKGWQSVLGALLAPTADALRAAVPVADAVEIPVVFRVVVRRELARTLILDGDRADRAEAAALLAEAGALAEQYQHVRLKSDVADLVEAAGFAEGASEGMDSLTARERQVFELIAEGLSNRQIGERLFISVKTVSVHVSAVLRKLEVSSRNEAAARYRVTADSVAG